MNIWFAQGVPYLVAHGPRSKQKMFYPLNDFGTPPLPGASPHVVRNIITEGLHDSI